MGMLYLERKEINSIITKGEHKQTMESLGKAWVAGNPFQAKEAIKGLQVFITSIEREFKKDLWENIRP